VRARALSCSLNLHTSTSGLTRALAFQTLKDENKRRSYDFELRMTGGRHRDDFQQRQQQQQQHYDARQWHQDRASQKGWRHQKRDEHFEQWYSQHSQTFSDFEELLRAVCGSNAM
jgi:curved DNA-binding protein CbpA